MSSQPAIRVDGLSKHYRIGARQQGYKTLRESISDACWSPVNRIRKSFASKAAKGDADGSTERLSGEDFWALNDVSFEVQPGEVVGIIGRNGAGKSTLLKILSRITEPTSGKIELRGRVGSLLEVGTGFHPELSGRENIYMNGSILGMARREITRKFDEIVAFAEVEDFLDTPVKRYSSGMYVRLAFAVAAHLEPEILIVDEVLAVGDQTFQGKCMGKMRDVAREGRTVLVVSHSMASILHLCQSVILIEGGKCVYRGDAEAGVARLLRRSSQANNLGSDLLNHSHRRAGMNAHLRHCVVRNAAGEITNQIGCGEPFEFEFTVDGNGVDAAYNLQVGIENKLGVRIATIGTNFSSSGPLTVGRSTKLTCQIDGLPLPPGPYAVTLLLGPAFKPLIDAIDHALAIDLTERDYLNAGRLPLLTEGLVLIRSSWSSKKAITSQCV
ncbi:ABC transporter ATP-binding protein [Anatilimnocola sp. NA78]|uniref:ABC transporter ATP-binding protein n=1 Tax=Anatilimnocola sp. NA78 TaxID=3415683 RepID=UPI003CE490EF